MAELAIDATFEKVRQVCVEQGEPPSNDGTTMIDGDGDGDQVAWIRPDAALGLGGGDELGDQRCDPPLDVIADRAYSMDALACWVGEHPVLVPFSMGSTGRCRRSPS
jgi:hypothetical protein